MTKKIIATKPGGSNSNLDALLKGLDENELLTDKGKRLPVDLHQKIHRVMGELQLRITTKDGKKVTNKMLVTEALQDLFKKYEQANKDSSVETEYTFNPGESFESKL